MDKRFLRVGNYIKYIYKDKCKIGIVRNIKYTGRLTIVIENENQSVLVINTKTDFSPNNIHITEEWLYSFGFKKMIESEYTLNTYELNGLEVWDKNGDFSEVLFLTNKLSVTLQGVHHLQNLYYELLQEQLELKDSSLVTLRLECN